MSPVGAIIVPFPPKTRTNMLHPRPAPPNVELAKCEKSLQHGEGRIDSIDEMYGCKHSAEPEERSWPRTLHARRVYATNAAAPAQKLPRLSSKPNKLAIEGNPAAAVAAE